MFEKQGKFGLYAGIVQFTIIILYGLLVRYGKSADSSANNPKENEHSANTNLLKNFPGTYAMFQDIHVMIFIGFGFLMTFLKKYGYSAVGLNLFLAALAGEIYILVIGLFEIKGEDWVINVDLMSLINADFAAAAILISFGAVLGKTSPLQLLFMVIPEVFAYCLNNWINTTYLKAADVGGSMVIHIFGAYFGLAVAFALRRNDFSETDKEGSVYHSDLFSMIGTVFLWIFWPSFNAVTAVDDDQHRAVINTYLALCASCIITFIVSNCVGPENHKFNMVHVQNATLAGGVAVGTAADTMLQPLGAIIVGSIAGLISTLGYRFVQPFLQSKINLHDTCGVNNLHGMPGLLAGIVGIVVMGIANENEYGSGLVEQFQVLGKDGGDYEFQKNRSSLEQAGFQATTMVVTLFIAIIVGLLTGTCMHLPCFENPTIEIVFDDGGFWELPTDDTEVTVDPVISQNPSATWRQKIAPANPGRNPTDPQNRVTLIDDEKAN